MYLKKGTILNYFQIVKCRVTALFRVEFAAKSAIKSSHKMWHSSFKEKRKEKKPFQQQKCNDGKQSQNNPLLRMTIPDETRHLDLDQFDISIPTTQSTC